MFVRSMAPNRDETDGDVRGLVVLQWFLFAFGALLFVVLCQWSFRISPLRQWNDGRCKRCGSEWTFSRRATDPGDDETPEQDLYFFRCVSCSRELWFYFDPRDDSHLRKPQDRSASR